MVRYKKIVLHALLSVLLVCLICFFIQYVLLGKRTSFNISEFDAQQETNFSKTSYNYIKETKFSILEMFYDCYFFHGNISSTSDRYSYVKVYSKDIKHKKIGSPYSIIESTVAENASLNYELNIYKNSNDDDIYYQVFFTRNNCLYELFFDKKLFGNESLDDDTTIRHFISCIVREHDGY